LCIKFHVKIATRIWDRLAEKTSNIGTLITYIKITHFVITEYRRNCNHEFDWNRVEILDRESV